MGRCDVEGSEAESQHNQTLCDLPSNKPRSGPSEVVEDPSVSLRIRLIALLPAILRSRRSSSSIRRLDREGDPTGDEEDDTDDARRVRLFDKVGMGMEDVRGGEARFSGDDGPAEPKPGEVKPGDVTPKPW